MKSSSPASRLAVLRVGRVHGLLKVVFALALLSVFLPQLRATEVPVPGKAFDSSLQQDELEPGAFAEWENGEEKLIEFEPENPGSAPEWILWTAQTKPGHSSRKFGMSDRVGPRHLRIGFTSELPVGTVVVEGGGRLSVLKDSGNFPGDMGNEDEWLPAQRLVDGRVSTAEAEPGQLVAWILPPGTKTRALRFSHSPKATDPTYGAEISGIYVMPERLENVAPLALVQTLSNNLNAKKLNNEFTEGWGAWENRENSQDREGIPLITPEHPEWVILDWKKPVTLRGLMVFFAAFGTADVQVYTGPESTPPQDAPEDAWKTIDEYDNILIGYPSFWPNWLPFPSDVTCRALRLRMTSTNESKDMNPNLEKKHMEGRRVWMDELMALAPLGDKPLADRVAAAGTGGGTETQLHPPIPVKFTLKEPGYVTLVIEKPNGVRVRNLVSETFFPAGENTVWWDGSDDLERDVTAARHGAYHIPASQVAPGAYRVRGLTRKVIVPRLEFSVYSAGNPAWVTKDQTGAWLSNHSAPQAAAFVPGYRHPSGKDRIYLGSLTSEGRASLAWVDLEGRKLGGQNWLGGNWRGAPFLAFDPGPRPVEDDIVYTASVGSIDENSPRMELRIVAMTTKGKDRTVFPWQFDGQDRHNSTQELAGLAVYDGMMVASLPKLGRLLFVDALSDQEDKERGSIPFTDSRGLAFDSEGRLYVVTATGVVRFANVKDPSHLPAPEVLVSSGLEDAQQIAIDDVGHLFVSDWGNSHQVKVFAPPADPGKAYTLKQTIGHPGAPKAGPYDPLHMNHPDGITMDSQHRLWVAEKDYLPKRISVWNQSGALEKAFYGPSKYGGGGAISSEDKNVFYYGEEGHGAMAFALDWEKGTSELKSVYYRPGPSDLKLAFRNAGPEVAYTHNGKRYFTNGFNSNPIFGSSSAFLFIERDGIAYPVASVGAASHWDAIKGEDFHYLWPAGADPTRSQDERSEVEAYYVWSDLNGDAQVQPEEVVIQAGRVGGVTVMPDLSFCVASVDKDRTIRLAPTEVTAAGVPIYDAENPEVLAVDPRFGTTSGGYQVLHDPNGWSVLTFGAAPFDGRSLTGVKDRTALWSYPSVWPGLAEGHEAPIPDRPGQLIGTTRLLGGFFEVPGTDVGPLWAINSNLGMVYLFTEDGLFVATLFHDMRTAPALGMPKAIRGADVSDMTLGEENFWPTISRTPDGQVYLVDGNNSTIIRLDGLETIRRLPDQSLTVTAEQLLAGQAYLQQVETLRQKEEGQGILPVSLLPSAPTLADDFKDWPANSWVDIDKTGVKANFNSPSRPFDITGALAVADGRLYAGYRTKLPKLLENSGEIPHGLFKTGGALDLMIGADPAADPDRKAPVPGDLRLLVTLVDGQPQALLYRAVVPGTKDADKVPFSSPWRTITFDAVEDITSQVEFAADEGNYQFSVPLSLLGIQPSPGLRLKGDIGVLRGDDHRTTARVYWGNKATSIVSDVPSEAALTPSLWGTLEFQAGSAEAGP